MKPLPLECYKYGNQEQPTGENIKPLAIDSLNPVDLNGEIQLNVLGASYKWPGYMDESLLYSINVVKSIFIEFIKVTITPSFALGLAVTGLSTKKLQSVILCFNRLAFRVLQPFILKDFHRPEFGQELQWLIFSFLTNVGITEDSADKFSEIIAFAIESDSAYPPRIKDMLSETTKEKLHDRPINEIMRLIEINYSREIDKEYKNVSKKFKWIGRMVALSLILPKYRKAFKKSLIDLNIENLQLKDQDIYWGTYKHDYDLMGLTFDERQEYAEKKGWKFPTPVVYS